MESDRALELAVETAEFIEQQKRGVVWARTTESDSAIDHSLYRGTAGIIVFLLELATATGDESYQAQAVAAGRELADVVANKSWASVAFATGWSGYAFVFSELHKRTDDPVFAAMVETCAERLLAQSSPLGNGGGIGWIEPMPFSDITGFTGDREVYDLSVGAAGSGLAFLSLADRPALKHHLASAVRIGERLLEVGEETPEGRRWGLMSDMPFPFTAPNFAHGGAGVGYFYARLYTRTSDERFLSAAVDAARYVNSRSSAVGDGALVCHTEEQTPPEFYLGQCHGPAGTARLYVLLHRITGEPAYLESIAAMYRGIRALNAPSTRSWGWWNNHSRCCGDAGLGDAALLLASVVPAPHSDGFLQLAHDCAAVIEGASASDGGARSWTQAEHRARPRFLETQTGFMQGAAGIGSFLAHLAAPSSRIAFPEDVL
jgi:lantibiotic modifying enzyme